MKSKTSNIPPGFIDELQFDKIIRLAESLPVQSNVLEIGAGFGRSTFAWLTGLRESNLFVVDSWEWHNLHNGLFEKMQKFDADINDWNKIKEINDHYLSWKYFVDQHPSCSQIKKVFSMTIQEYRQQDLQNYYDCVYLDDSHDPADMIKSLEYFCNCPIICGDDYNDSWPELCKVIDRFAEQYNKKITVDQSGFWRLT